MESSLPELLLTSSPDGRIAAYDTSTGFTVAEFKGSRTPRKGLTLIGKRLIAVSHVSPDTGNGSVHLYNWWTATPFYKFPMPEPVAPLLATRDGLYLFAGGVSGEIHSISVPSGDVILSVAAHSKPITCLEMNVDGSLIFSGSDDGTIAVFGTHQLLDSFACEDPSHLSALQRFIGHESSITAITTGTGQCNFTMISCSLDSTCKFWSLMQNTPLLSITFPCTIWELKMDPLETEFYGAGSDGFLYKGELKVTSRSQAEQGLEIIPWNEKQDGPLTSMATLYQGQYIVTASEEGNICFWEATTGELVKFLDQQQTGSISHLAVVTGLKDSARAPLARQKEIAGFHSWELEFLSKRVPSLPIEQEIEMKEELAVAVTDRKRSIDTLELAIGGYEKLLKFMLRETKAETRATTSNSRVEDEPKRNERQ